MREDADRDLTEIGEIFTAATTILGIGITVTVHYLNFFTVPTSLSYIPAKRYAMGWLFLIFYLFSRRSGEVHAHLRKQFCFCNVSPWQIQPN